MKTEAPPFDFGVLRVLDCGFAIQEAVNPVLEKIKIGYGMNFLFDVDNDWIEYVIKAEFKDGENNQSILSGSVLTRFSVNKLSSFVDDTDKLVFPAGSVEALFGIAFTHMRAILAKNVAGSRFSALLVPVINPAPIFHELLRMNEQHGKAARELAGQGKEIQDIDFETVIKK